MADCGSVDMETLIWQLVDRFLPACEQCGGHHPHHRPDLITRVSDLMMVSDTCHVESPAERTADAVNVPPGRHPVYVGTFEVDSPEAGPGWHVASMLFVPLAEPERIASAQHWIEDDTSVPQPVTDYVVLSDLEAWRLPGDPLQGPSPMQAFLRDVEGSAEAGQLGAPSTWPSRVLDDESGLNVLALPMADRFLRSVRGGDDEELLAVMYLSYDY
jgi:hypothetical protein